MIYLVTTQVLPRSDKYSIIKAQEALDILEPLYKVGLDTETTGFDVYTKKLLTVQLGCYDFQVVIDCTTIDIGLFKEYLQSDRLFIGWNIKFDIKFLLHQRIVLKNVYDGFIAEKLMWLGYPSGFHSMSLKSAGKNYLNIELDKTVRGRIMWSGLTDEVIEYSANDVKYLEKIMDIQQRELYNKKLDIANQYEQKSVPWLAYTEYCGVALDIDRWKRKMSLDDFCEQIFLKALNDWVVSSALGEKYSYHYIQIDGLETNELEKARKKMIGVRCPEKDIKGIERGYAEAYKVTIEKKIDGKFINENIQGDLFLGFLSPSCNINWDSPKQVIPLFKSLGFDLNIEDKETGSTKESIESKIIEPQLKTSTIAYLYLQYKAARKLTSTYGKNVINQINPVSGRIHTNFNQLGTDTGRLSSGGKDKSAQMEYLNFQNFPNDAETRACFVAEKGMKWISCDYSGQESRIIADITNDKELLDLFNKGCGDVHSLTAKISYPDVIGDTPVEEIKQKFKHYRQSAKEIEFSINYGGNANTIAKNKNISLQEATKIYNDYMKGFAGIKLYQDKQRKFVMDNGYILLNPLSGHKSFIYDFEELKKLKDWIKTVDWDNYRELKKTDPNSLTVQRIKHFFKRKSASEKQAINYPCQGGIPCPV